MEENTLALPFFLFGVQKCRACQGRPRLWFLLPKSVAALTLSLSSGQAGGRDARRMRRLCRFPPGSGEWSSFLCAVGLSERLCESQPIRAWF